MTPSRIVIDNLQSLLDDFALDGLRISKDRYYLPPDQGGLGLIHIGTFLVAQKCSWVKRVHNNTIDNWGASSIQVSLSQFRRDFS